MKRIILIFILGICTGANAATLFVLDNVNDDLYSIETNDLTNPVFIGSIGNSGVYKGLIITMDGKLSSIDRATSEIVKINSANPLLTSAVALDYLVTENLEGLARSPNGEIYVILPGMVLGLLDPSSGMATPAAVISGLSVIEAMAFAPNGTLYVAGAAGTFNVTPPKASTSLFTVDTNTGQTSLIGSMISSGVTDIDALTWADGYLFGANARTSPAEDLWQIDPSNANAVNLGNTGLVGISGLAAAPVPTPAAFLLFASALGLLRVARREAA